MNRTFPLNDIPSQTLRLKSPLEIVQEPLPDGKFRAYAKDLALGFEGNGESWSVALQDFIDSLVTAAEQGLDGEVARLVEPRPEQVGSAVPTQVNSAVPAPSSGEVYVLLDGEIVIGVTTDAKWARRWARWNPKGSYKKFTLNELPEADDEEA